MLLKQDSSPCHVNQMLNTRLQHMLCGWLSSTLEDGVDIYMKLVTGATSPKKCARCFQHQAERMWEAQPRADRRLSRPRILSNVWTGAIATVHSSIWTATMARHVSLGAWQR